MKRKDDILEIGNPEIPLLKMIKISVIAHNYNEKCWRCNCSRNLLKRSRGNQRAKEKEHYKTARSQNTITWNPSSLYNESWLKKVHSWNHQLDLVATASSTDIMKVDRPASLRYWTSPFISLTSFLLMSKLIPSSDASASVPNIWLSNSSGTPPPVWLILQADEWFLN